MEGTNAPTCTPHCSSDVLVFKAGNMLAETGPDRPEIGPMPLELAQYVPEIGASPLESRPSLVEFRPKLLGIDQTWLEFDRFGAISTKYAAVSPIWARNPSLARYRPQWEELRQVSEMFGPGSAELGPTSAEFGPHSAKPGLPRAAERPVLWNACRSDIPMFESPASGKRRESPSKYTGDTSAQDPEFAVAQLLGNSKVPDSVQTVLRNMYSLEYPTP